MMFKKLKYLSRISFLILSFFIITNGYVIQSTKSKIISQTKAFSQKDIDYILVLGAGIKNKRPSPMLEERLNLSILFYQNNPSPQILISGDHVKAYYDEVSVMKNYLLENNIKEEKIVTDYAGISTYDSIYRAKYIYHAKKMIIITQKYHLYRALYIAKHLDINAYGLTSDQKIYKNQEKREIREFLARTKDFVKSFLKLPATYLSVHVFKI